MTTPLAVHYTIDALPEDTSIGDCFAMGTERCECITCNGKGMDDCPECDGYGCTDVDLDAEECKRINAELDAGNEWAWCIVRVRAHLGDYVGTDYLGGCSYKNEADFVQPGGYYDDMKAEALNDLRTMIHAMNDRMSAMLVALEVATT